MFYVYFLIAAKCKKKQERNAFWQLQPWTRITTMIFGELAARLRYAGSRTDQHHDNQDSGINKKCNDQQHQPER
jgi:hypothetical protein